MPLFERHIETLDIGGEIRPYLRATEAELLRGVMMTAMCAAAVPGMPLLHSRTHGGAKVTAEERVDALQRAEWLGHELAVVHVQKSILANSRPRRDGPLGADPQMLGIVPPEFLRAEPQAGRLERA